jgi:hypothetical protein
MGPMIQSYSIDRPQSAGEEIANALSHGLAFLLAVASLPILVSFAARDGSAANIAASGLDAALSLPEENPLRKDLVAALEADALAVVENPQLQIAADDRSGVYYTLVDARKAADDSVGARAMADRLRESVAGIAFPEMGRNVTISIGLSSYPDHADDKQGLIRTADTALYEAKRQGRNRVVGRRAGGGRVTVLRESEISALCPAGPTLGRPSRTRSSIEP